MNIIIEQALEGDIPALTNAMTRAFDHDAQVHLGVENGGPEGCDDGELPTWPISGFPFCPMQR